MIGGSIRTTRSRWNAKVLLILYPILMIALLAMISSILGCSAELTNDPFWTSDLDDRSYCVAWGDYDNDGDLDLAVGRNGPNYIYENEDGNLSTEPVWVSNDTAETEITQEVTWGDIDDNGWVDLVAVNGAWGSGYDVVYLNFGGNVSTTANWTNENSDQSNGMDLRDFDGDGDLDLATANYNNRECVYENVDGELSTSPIWQSYLYDDGTMDVVFFDVDGDDDLDLYVACSATMDSTDSNANRMYINDPEIWGDSHYGVLPDWTANDELWTTCAKSADIDADGDVDIIAANGFNNCNLVVMYENTGTTLDRDYTWSVDINWPVACDVADVNGDGWIDVGITTYNRGYPNYVVLNDNGTLDDETSWNGTDDPQSRRCAFGDMNGDGYPEFAVANYNGSSSNGNDVVYLNVIPLPWVYIESPSEGAIVNGTVEIGGEAGTSVNGTLLIQVSLDNGTTWENATGETGWVYQWNTTHFENGNHTITARSLRLSLSSRYYMVNVTVKNVRDRDPTVTIETPEDGSSVKGSVWINGSAFDPDGNDDIVEVRIKLGNRNWKTVDDTTDWSYSWDTTREDNGPITIRVEVEDRDGALGTDEITVEVDNCIPGPPWIVIQWPSDGLTVSGTFNITGTAGGDVEIESVTVEVDDDDIMVIGTSDWSAGWDSTIILHENITIIATVEDVDGRTNSTSITVLVDNRPATVNEPPSAEFIDRPSRVDKGVETVFRIDLDDPDGIDDITTVNAYLYDAEGRLVREIAGEEFDLEGGQLVLSVSTDGLEGWYDLTVVVTDLGGEESETSVGFEVVTAEEDEDDGPDPMFTILFAIAVILIAVLILGHRRGGERSSPAPPEKVGVYDVEMVVPEVVE